MNVIVYAASALSVAVLFYSWRSYHEKTEQASKSSRTGDLHAVGHGELGSRL